MPTPSMVLGTLVAGRYMIERAVGRGATSTVYRAIDERTGQPVALKLLRSVDGTTHQANRVALEAQVLAELRHPGIVSYVAHGHTASGTPFLAMEWLEGEDLEQLLMRRPLSLRETLVLLRRAAEALSAAHTRGIIHRDLKPSNLFLRDGRLDQLTIVDFGIARQMQRTGSLTATGVIIGTPGYMSPEQARGDRNITAAADIFALGGIIYRCLTGRLPVQAPNLSALLAKLLFEDVAPIAIERPDLPIDLALLIDRMLAKQPEKRPQNGDHLLHALAVMNLAQLDDRVPNRPEEPPGQRLFQDELRPVSVIMTRTAARGPVAPVTAELEEKPTDDSLERAMISRWVAESDGEVIFLVDGSIVAFLSEAETTSDLALRATQCALLLRRLPRQELIAVSTGTGHVQGHRVSGDAVERLVEFLHAQELDEGAGVGIPRGSILLDQNTAELIQSHYATLRASPGLFFLGDEQVHGGDSARDVGGRSMCIGRERELGILNSALAETQEESSARAILIIAESGMGKTCLAREFSRRTGEHAPTVTVLSTAVTSLDSENPYSLLAGLLGMSGGARSAERRNAALMQLDSRIRRHVPQEHQQFVHHVLSDLIAPNQGDPRTNTGASAGTDLRLRDQVGLAFLRLLSGLCTSGPVMVLLDDLQWADADSIRTLDLTLRVLAGLPFFVCAVARPEAMRRFPRLWREHRMQVIHLDPLSRSSCFTVARRLLQQAVPETTLQALTDAAGGNPRLLQTMISAEQEGRDQELPGGVILLLQGRVMNLSPELRRVLCAASMCPQPIHRAPVVALLSQVMGPLEVERALQGLVNLHLLLRERPQGSNGEEIYRFQRAAMRLAVQGLVTAEDRLQAELVLRRREPSAVAS